MLKDRIKAVAKTYAEDLSRQMKGVPAGTLKDAVQKLEKNTAKMVVEKMLGNGARKDQDAEAKIVQDAFKIGTKEEA